MVAMVGDRDVGIRDEWIKKNGARPYMLLGATKGGGNES